MNKSCTSSNNPLNDSLQKVLQPILYTKLSLQAAYLKVIETEDLPPQEKLIRQMDVNCAKMPFHNDIEAFIFKMRTGTHQFLSKPADWYVWT